MAFPERPTRRHPGRLVWSRPAVLLGALLSLSGCATAPDAIDRAPDPVPSAAPLVAVFPVQNLSGKPAPLEEVRRLLIERLRSYGIPVLDDTALERALTRHRVRYMAGIERRFANALQQETGTEAILIPSLELYEEGSPPQVALFARLVSTGEAPVVRWIDGTGAAGNDAPGVLGIGLIEDPYALLTREVDVLARSLARDLSGAGTRPGGRSGGRKFQPKIVYRSAGLDPARAYSIAVVPFFNKSSRKYAGEIIALHLMRSLAAFPNLRVVEPGVVREELLRYRIIMSDGISLTQTETVSGAVSADLVLNGEVLEYQDPRGPGTTPSVDFAILFIERATGRVVYSSYSHTAGDDGVFFFDWGRVNTTHALASAMAQAIGQRMVLGPPTTR